MNETQLVVVLSAILTLAPALFMMCWALPKRATWPIAVPLTIVYIALAVGWFWAFQWQGMPFWVYVDVGVYGLMACTTILVAIAKHLGAYEQKQKGQGADG